MTVEDVSNQTDHFSHGKGSKDRSDPEAFDVAEEEEGQSGSHGEAGHVEGDLDSGVGYFEDLSCFTREQVGRDDRGVRSGWRVQFRCRGRHSSR